MKSLYSTKDTPGSVYLMIKLFLFRNEEYHLKQVIRAVKNFGFGQCHRCPVTLTEETVCESHYRVCNVRIVTSTSPKNPTLSHFPADKVFFLFVATGTTSRRMREVPCM